ncbi:MAG: hypothetical protein ACRD9W_24905 [Terriglobia bacterium]
MLLAQDQSGKRITVAVSGPEARALRAARTNDARLDAVELPAIITKGMVWTGFERVLDLAKRDLGNWVTAFCSGQTLTAEETKQVENLSRKWTGTLNELASSIPNASTRREPVGAGEIWNNAARKAVEAKDRATAASIAEIESQAAQLWEQDKPQDNPLPAATPDGCAVQDIEAAAAKLWARR